MALRVRGRVIGGHLRVDIPVDLPENTEVELVEVAEVITGNEPEEELDPLLEAALDAGDAAFERGERGRPLEDVLDRLRTRSRDEAVSGSPAGRG
jgi:hypothetical protein